MSEWGIHWFRRDLRIPGNAALRAGFERTRGRTVGLFCFDGQFQKREDFSANRFAFFLETLRALREDLRARGGDLLVLDERAQSAFPRLLAAAHSPPALVTWSRDYEPYARARDGEVEKLLGKHRVPTHKERDHLLFDPSEIVKDDGSFYQVYSPFGRRWFQRLAEREGQDRVLSQGDKIAAFRRPPKKDLFAARWADVLARNDFPDAFDKFVRENQKRVTVPIPRAGFTAAYNALQDFGKRSKNYKTERDFPAVPGTSRLSIYLKNGSLTVPQVLHELRLEKADWDAGGNTQFVKELAWREFYYSILYHRPDVETGPFHQQYAGLKWENDEKWFRRWCEGTTGFPIVDAGMRELLATGWMHNRVRMIVASFLTKDLLIDWRWGEQHFMQHLLDGDLAPNNGGWQWAASTGCDPQPYFRVFNPWLQGKKFDPNGDYIRAFVPELAKVPAKALHDPEGDRGKYPSPIVKHATQRTKAIALYKNA